MRELNIDEIRNIQLNILKKFTEICEKNQLRYYLDSGTLIGAIRHNGYIPWDDDIDICMPRCDYDIFMRKFGGRIDENIRILSEKDNIYSYPKIIDERTIIEEYPSTLKNEYSIYIDVFPKDGICSNLKKAKKQCASVKRLINMNWFLKYSVYRWNDMGKLWQRILAFIGRKFIRNKDVALHALIKKSKKYSYDQSEYVATIVAGGLANCVSKECFDSYIMVQFEKYQFRVPVGYDEYLRKLYGDYMVLPEEGKRVRHHNFKAYIKEDVEII
ncbi:MAG: LicD family protein [Bacillota bacterium]